MIFAYNGQNNALKRVLISDFGWSDEGVDTYFKIVETVNSSSYYLSDDEIDGRFNELLGLLESKFKIYCGYKKDNNTLWADSEDFYLIPLDENDKRIINISR